MTRRRCCCPRKDACLIWKYDPTHEDIGKPIDPPWFVTGAGSWSVISGAPWEYDAVLQVTGPAKFFHRTPHRDRHYTGRLRVNFSFPSTTGARYRLLYNAVKSGDIIGAGGYFALEWIPFLSGGKYNDARFLKQTDELFDLKNDAPLYWAEVEDEDPDTEDTTLEVIFRCESASEGPCEATCPKCKDNKAPDIWEIEIAGIVEGTCGECPGLNRTYRVYQDGQNNCLWSNNYVGTNCDPASISLQVTESGGVYTITVTLGGHTWTKTFNEPPDCCTGHTLTHAGSSGDCDSTGATCLIRLPEDASAGDTIDMGSWLAQICEVPYKDPGYPPTTTLNGCYVGFEIPDNVTVQISSVGFYEVEDTYEGDEEFCRWCPCNYCGGVCLNLMKPVTITYESSCPHIDGHSYELEPTPEAHAEWERSFCAAWKDNHTPTAGLGQTCGVGVGEWTTDPVILGLDRAGKRALPDTYEFDPQEWCLYAIGCAYAAGGEDDPVHANENSTCDPFYLEFGPFALKEIETGLDPPYDKQCCCSPCDLEDCEWFKVIVTQSA